MSSTLVKPAGKVTGYPNHRRNFGENIARRPSRTKDHSRRIIHRTGFLKQPLKTRIAKPDIDHPAINQCFTQENFTFLFECAVHYAELLGKTIDMPTGSIHERICVLYHHFSTVLPESHRLNFELGSPPRSEEEPGKADRLFWLIYHVHHWENHCLYWIPVKFLTLLSGKIRDIAMSFMHLLIHRNGMFRFCHGYEYDLLFDAAIENVEYYANDESDQKKIEELLLSYRHGAIASFLDELYGYHPLDVAVALEEYHPACPKEKNLLDCLIKGLPFLREDCIMNYDYDPYCDGIPEECEDYPPVTLDRIVRYVYEKNDFVSNEFKDFVNQDIQEGYAIEPTSFMYLDTSSKLFNPGNYPERFSDWYWELTDVINEFTDHE